MAPRLERGLVLVWLSLGCGQSEPEPTMEPEPAAEPDPEPSTLSEPETVPVPTGDLPDPVVFDGAAEVAILGFGVRLVVHPPFQAAMLGEQFDDLTLVVSWWDVLAKGAGVDGRAGLHNTVLKPGVPVADAVPVAGTRGEGRRLLHTLTFGEGGTEVRLPEGFDGLGKALSLGPGPVHPAWRVQVDQDEPLDWPSKTMLHSNDPTTGSPVAFEGRPRKPWGPWAVGDAPPVLDPP